MPSTKPLSLLAGLLVAGSFVGAVAACSNSSSGSASGDDGDAAADVKTTPKPDGGDAGPTCPPTEPFTAKDIEDVLDWRPPAPPQSVCTQQNIDDVKKLFTQGNGSAKYADIKAALGASCTACVFTQISATNWGVYIEDDGGTASNGLYACFAEVDGNACGKAAFEFNACENIVCGPDFCADQDASDACKPVAAKGACKGLNDAVTSACKGLKTDIDACGNLFQAIRAVCAGGPDAAIDAESP